jgi:hypothetical protein
LNVEICFESNKHSGSVKPSIDINLRNLANTAGAGDPVAHIALILLCDDDVLHSTYLARADGKPLVPSFRKYARPPNRWQQCLSPTYIAISFNKFEDSKPSKMSTGISGMENDFVTIFDQALSSERTQSVGRACDKYACHKYSR